MEKITSMEKEQTFKDFYDSTWDALAKGMGMTFEQLTEPSKIIYDHKNCISRHAHLDYDRLRSEAWEKHFGKLLHEFFEFENNALIGLA